MSRITYLEKYNLINDGRRTLSPNRHNERIRFLHTHFHYRMCSLVFKICVTLPSGTREMENSSLTLQSLYEGIRPRVLRLLYLVSLPGGRVLTTVFVLYSETIDSAVLRHLQQKMFYWLGFESLYDRLYSVTLHTRNNCTQLFTSPLIQHLCCSVIFIVMILRSL